MQSSQQMLVLYKESLMKYARRNARWKQARPALSAAVAFVFGTAMFGLSTMFAALTLI